MRGDVRGASGDTRLFGWMWLEQTIASLVNEWPSEEGHSAMTGDVGCEDLDKLLLKVSFLRSIHESLVLCLATCYTFLVAD